MGLASKTFLGYRAGRINLGTLAAVTAYFGYSFALYSKLGFLNRHLITFSATAFREFVRRYDIATIIVTPFGVESDLVVSYLTDAFGPPQTRSAGEVRYWQVGP